MVQLSLKSQSFQPGAAEMLVDHVPAAISSRPKLPQPDQKLHGPGLNFGANG
jgi:hypothetical protein